MLIKNIKSQDIVFKYLYYFTFLIMISCSTSAKIQSDIYIYPEHYGADSHDDLSDDEAFKKAITNCIKYKKIFKLRDGTYIIHKIIIIQQADQTFIMEGSTQSVIKVPEHGFLRIQSASINKQLVSVINSGDKSFEIDNIEGLKEGQIIRISSDSHWETGWKYKENDTHIIDKIEGKRIYTQNPILFNYHPNNENIQVTFSEMITARFKDFSLILDSEQSWNKTTAIEVVSMKVQATNLTIKDTRRQIFHRGFSIVNSPAIVFKNLILDGLEYGVLMNYCRNIHVDGIEAKMLRHSLAPANATIDMYAKNITGYYCQGVIDAHQCFNIHYDSIQDINASQFSNCRALGTKITNSIFNADSSFYQDYMYWSNQFLTPEYEHLYQEYDTYFDKVTWVHAKPSGFNGLTTFSCRNFIITNCKTHNISLYGKLYGIASINNSSIGSIRINSHNVVIDSCIMDGHLFKDTRYVFRFTGAGDTKINNVVGKNYNSSITDLFEYFYNTSHMNSVKITNSAFSALRSWSEKLIYPNLEYKTLYIDNSDFKGFSKKLPGKIFTPKVIKENLRQVSGLNINTRNIE